MQVVSVSGLIGAGKDTAAGHLIERGFTRYSFSAALKDAVAAVFGIDRAILEGDTPEAREAREAVDPWWSRELGFEVSARSILQKVGTEAMRNHFHPNIWVLTVKRRIDKDLSAGPFTGGVMSDARFFNELDMVYQMGGTTIRVIREEPEWATQFQLATFSAVSRELGRPYAILNLGKEDIATHVRATAVVVLCGMGIDVHQSEWEHLLWNKYVTVHNDSDLETLFRRINSVV